MYFTAALATGIAKRAARILFELKSAEIHKRICATLSCFACVYCLLLPKKKTEFSREREAIIAAKLSFVCCGCFWLLNKFSTDSCNWKQIHFNEAYDSFGTKHSMSYFARIFQLNRAENQKRMWNSLKSFLDFDGNVLFFFISPWTRIEAQRTKVKAPTTLSCCVKHNQLRCGKSRAFDKYKYFSYVAWVSLERTNSYVHTYFSDSELEWSEHFASVCRLCCHFS